MNVESVLKEFGYGCPGGRPGVATELMAQAILELRAERDALQSEVERLRDTLDHARFKCTMLAGRTTYSPEQFENGRYVCGELAEEIKRVLVRREAVKPELEPGEYKRALRDAHDKIDALQSEVARLKSERDAQVSEKVKAIGLYGLEVLETKRLREALEFYADYEEWVDYKAVCTDGTGVDSHFDGDMGQRAREALQQSSVPHPGEES